MRYVMPATSLIQARTFSISAPVVAAGAIPTPEDEELRRLLPVLREMVGWGVPVSVNTYKWRSCVPRSPREPSMINEPFPALSGTPTQWLRSPANDCAHA